MRGLYLIVSVVLVFLLGTLAAVYPEGMTALLAISLLSALALFIFRKLSEERDFITKVFFAGLILRLLFGAFIYFFEFTDFFGGDALTYDYGGGQIAGYWLGTVPADDPWYIRSTSASTPGWGMFYFVGGIYWLLGKSFFTAQSICAVIGAATAPLIFLCSQRIYHNRNVAKFAAIAVGGPPSFVVWSGQLMKDGLIVFLLVLSVTLVLSLQEKFSYPAVILLMFTLFAVQSLRFYIFYMVAIAVVGSFIIGLSNSVASTVRRTVALVAVGLALTYFGVIRDATANFEKWGNLEMLQRSRSDLTHSADSGFGEEIDVSTTEGAISSIPLGLAYLMLAPFPWEVSSFRQAITLPEVLIWWAMIPLLLYGVWYTIMHRLRSAFPALFFSLMLTIAYSIFQGNVGTAYRQRTQIQVFLLMFVAVGWVLYKERKEDKRLINQSRKQRTGLEAF